jgi:PadR family transcriptional regulator PadR
LGGIEQWVVQLRKGIAELLVLRLLAAQDRLHGYAIVKELMALGQLVAGESTVYPVLKRLEADGLLSSQWVEAGEGPPRKYYELSVTGAAFLAEAEHEWRALLDSMKRLEGGKTV